VQNIQPLPPELESFEAFQEHHWIEPHSGHCEPAPQFREEFRGQLRSALDRSLSRALTDFAGQMGAAWAYAKALEELGEPAIRPKTLADLAAIWREPTKTGQGRDPSRVAAIRHALGGSAGAADLRLMLVLEAMRPTREDMLWGDEVPNALAKAQFHEGPLPDLVSELLRFHAQSEADPFARIRTELNKTPAPKVDHGAVLKKKREELHDEIKHIRLNAGRAYIGRFEHCSKAWDVFMEKLLPPLKEMFLDGPAEWDPAAKSLWIGQLIPAWEKVADRFRVR
jgi:hypothetical protein